MPKPGTRNILYVLENGAPDEWALSRDVPAGELVDGVAVYRFNDVPDELADEISDSGKPRHSWDELMKLPHDVL